MSNSTTVVIKRALMIMVVCWIVGRVIGGVAQSTVDRQIIAYKKANPIPPDYHPPAATEGDDSETVSSTPAGADNANGVATSSAANV
ncbi:MAG: hypothetical protein IT440_11990 [Phycisphaeraceae bacterium]|nr:hypothetical protein [Phycisphaeraceae bacterium]